MILMNPNTKVKITIKREKYSNYYNPIKVGELVNYKNSLMKVSYVKEMEDDSLVIVLEKLIDLSLFEISNIGGRVN